MMIPLHRQRLLDCLRSIFCAIFKMELINTNYKLLLWFWGPNSRIASGVILKYRDIVVAFKDRYKCLGVVLHATNRMLTACL
jgi:hypothetical protein